MSPGFSLIELIYALVLAAVIYTIALPVVGRARVEASVRNSKHVVVSSLALARATAIRFRRPAVLRLDSNGDRLWIEADTTVSGSGAGLDTIGFFDFRAELEVDLTSDRTSLCFDGRGIATTTAACSQSGGLIVVARDDRADTVVVSPLGRVVP